jgi:hypothetical protein
MSTTSGSAHVNLSRAGRVARAAELLRLGRVEDSLAAIDALRAEALADDGANAAEGAQSGAARDAALHVSTGAPTLVAPAAAVAPRPVADGFSTALESGQYSEEELVARALREIAL